MPNDIQKYSLIDKTDVHPNQRAYVIFLIGLLVFSLGMYAAVGLLPRRPTIIITYISVAIFILYQFFKHRENFNKPIHMIGIFIILIVFAVFSCYLYLNPSSVQQKKPHVDVSIGNFTLQKGIPAVSLEIKYENISEYPAYHFFNVTRLCVDSVTDRDSLDLLDIVGRHKEENITLVKILDITKIPFDSLTQSEFNYLSKRNLFTIGAISYYDDAQQYHLLYFCFEHLKNNKYINYPKYNSPL